MANWQALRQRSLPSDLSCLGRLPRLRGGHLRRSRFALPAVGMPRSISVVAPSGFGKTQLLAFWFYDLRARGYETFWVDSASDSAPLSLADGHSAMSGARETRAHRAIFLDNADRPGADALADRLIGDHQDGDVVVMAGTRAGERAPDPDCSFGQEDLRFSHEEAKALLYNRLNAPDPDVVADMILLSAGVPALLNIAIADLADDPRAFQASAGGNGRFLRAYVQDHIHHLTSDERSILWGIAILDGFSFDLAGHLTERSDCKALLTGLMRDLPFFLPACHRRNGLLPGLRAAILESGGDGRRLPALHGKAARWFVHRNEPAKAIDHAIAARDLDLVMDLMSRNLLEIVTTGELERVLGWLASVPRERMIESPELCLAAALAYLVAGEAELTELFLGRLSPDHRAIVLACHLSLKERYDEIDALLRPICSADNLSPVVAACYQNLKCSLQQRRGVTHSSQANIPNASRSAGPFRSIGAIGLLLETERLTMMGKAAEAIKAVERLTYDCEEQLGKSSSVTNLLSVSLASASCQAGDFDRAHRLLMPRLDSACLHNIPTVPCNALLVAARLAAARGDSAASIDLLERLETLGMEREVPRLCAIAQAERVRVYARTKQQMLASITLAALERTQVSVDASSPFHSSRVELEVLLARAHLLRSLGKADAMAPILDAADALARQLGRAMERAEAAILKHGEHQPKALDRVLDALGIDAADRRTLLRRMCSPVDGTDDIGALGPVSETPPFDILGRPVLVQMTDREIHILGGLSRDLSNKAIARELGLSNETVKWYIAKMLAKLGAQDRHQAVDRARAFGVLPMFQAKAWSNIMFTPGGPTASIPSGH